MIYYKIYMVPHKWGWVGGRNMHNVHLHSYTPLQCHPHRGSEEANPVVVLLPYVLLQLLTETAIGQ